MEAFALIPPPRLDDDEDVHWALSTANALWTRGERSEALKWLRRAAEQASDVNADARALELFKAAADVAGKVGSSPPPAPTAPSPSVAPPRPSAPPPPPRKLPPSTAPRAAVPVPSAPPAPRRPPSIPAPAAASAPPAAPRPARSQPSATPPARGSAPASASARPGDSSGDRRSARPAAPARAGVSAAASAPRAARGSVPAPAPAPDGAARSAATQAPGPEAPASAGAIPVASTSRPRRASHNEDEVTAQRKLPVGMREPEPSAAPIPLLKQLPGLFDDLDEDTRVLAGARAPDDVDLAFKSVLAPAPVPSAELYPITDEPTDGSASDVPPSANTSPNAVAWTPSDDAGAAIAHFSGSASDQPARARRPESLPALRVAVLGTGAAGEVRLIALDAAGEPPPGAAMAVLVPISAADGEAIARLFGPLE